MLFIIAAILFLFLIIAIGPLMSRVETPQYQILLRNKNFEIRQYSPQLIASVTTSGTRKEAINQGFRILADYIFGNNTKQKKLQKDGAIFQSEENEKIKMTAPVTQTACGNDWTTTFILPSEYTLETIPKPRNNSITVLMRDARKYATCRFSGTPTDSILSQKKYELEQWITSHHLETNGHTIFAFYNPPWTLPCLRRNEIMIELSR